MSSFRSSVSQWRRCRCLIIIAAMATTACSHVDMGQIDYRIADAPAKTTTRSLQPQEKCSDAIEADCDPILPSRVIRRYMPDPKTGWNAFKSPDVYSIEIEQGMIGSNILEGHILGKQFGKEAEIAILANVFEFASQESDAAARRFLESGEYPSKADDPSDVELKLVYFGEDIERRQAFNFSNIPLKARSGYGGGSVGIQIVIMEVDAQAGPVSSLLTTLARFGQQVAPVPGEAKDIIFDLGESLLAGSRDDKLFEYRFVLSSGHAASQANQATFAPGRYVLRRSQSRDTDMNWSELRLDHNTSRLFRKGKDNKYEEVREDLYLVLNIRPYPESTKAEYYSQKDWSDYRSLLQAAADSRAAPIQSVAENFEEMLIEARSKNWRDDLALKWATANDGLTVYRTRLNEQAMSCGATNLLREIDLSEREVRDAIRIFRAEYQRAAAAQRKDDTGKVLGQEFEAADREHLVSLVSTYFMPWSETGADRASFSSSKAFESSYVNSDAKADLAELSLEAARRQAKPAITCQTVTAEY